MSLQQYLISMFISTLVACAVFVSVLFFFNPYTSGTMALVFFYASLGVALVGIFSLVGYGLRHFFAPAKIAFRDVITSSRQSVLLTTLVLVSLFLKQVNLFNILSVALLIIMLTLIEVAVFTSKKSLR